MLPQKIHFKKFVEREIFKLNKKVSYTFPYKKQSFLN